MGVYLSIGTVVIALAGLIGWALWHLINDRKTYPSPSATQHNLQPADFHPEPEEMPKKETPATSQLKIPPNYFPTHSNMPSGGGGSWSFQRRGVYRRRKRWPRMEQ